MIIYCVILLLLAYILPGYGKTVEYDLFIENNSVNFTRKDVKAMIINGGIPGPTSMMLLST